MFTLGVAGMRIVTVWWILEYIKDMCIGVDICTFQSSDKKTKLLKF